MPVDPRPSANRSLDAEEDTDGSPLPNVSRARGPISLGISVAAVLVLAGVGATLALAESCTPNPAGSDPSAVPGAPGVPPNGSVGPSTPTTKPTPTPTPTPPPTPPPTIAPPVT